MKSISLPNWLQSIVDTAGGVGLFVIAFLDSSVLPLPVINDFIIIDLSAKNPKRMPYYAMMSTLGSVLGCVMLFFLAKKGGEAYFRKYAGARSDRIHGWVSNNGFLTVLVGALLPPPAPFKLVVIGAGALGTRLSSFVGALTIARSIRYFGEGYLAIKYGERAKHFVLRYKISASLVMLGVVVAIYLTVRFI